MDLDQQESALQRTFRKMTGGSLDVFLRRIEFLIFLLFLILVPICIGFPLYYGIQVKKFLIAAGLAFIYAICMYFFRHKIIVHYAFMLHFGVLLVISSTIFFETGYNRSGTAMAVIGVLSVIIFFVFPSLGINVVVRPRAGSRSPPAQQPPREGGVLFSELLQRDLLQNPVLPNGAAKNPSVDESNDADHIQHIDNLDSVPADQHVGQPGLEDDIDENLNPVLQNGNANNENEKLEDKTEDDDHDQALSNDHAIQMREGHLDNLDSVPADQHVGQPSLEDDIDDNLNPILQNGNANNENEKLEDKTEDDDHDQALSNDHAIQMREGPDGEPAKTRDEDDIFLE